MDIMLQMDGVINVLQTAKYVQNTISVQFVYHLLPNWMEVVEQMPVYLINLWQDLDNAKIVQRTALLAQDSQTIVPVVQKGMR